MSFIRICQGFEDSDRPRVCTLYWAAFGPKLGKVLGPEAKALQFLEQVADPGRAITAYDAHGTVMGVAGYKWDGAAMMGGGLRDLASVYGWLGCLWRLPFLTLLERAPRAQTLTMDGICVAPEARGQGVGTLLLGAIKDQARSLGCTSVRLDVIDTNARAAALYAREGFVEGPMQHLGPLSRVFGFSSATEMTFSLQSQNAARRNAAN